METKPTGLMRKTKQELVNIILRKDDLEKELRTRADNSEREMLEKTKSLKASIEEVNSTKLEVKKLNNALMNKSEEIKELSKAHRTAIDEVNDLRNECDDLTTTIAELKDTNKAFKVTLGIALFTILTLVIFL